MKVYSGISECGSDLASFLRCFFPQETFGATVETNAVAGRDKVAEGLTQGLFGLEPWLPLEPSRPCSSYLFYLTIERPCSLSPQPN